MERIYKGEIQRLFPILEAIKEGKTIQWLDMGLWRDIDGDEDGFFLDTLIGKTNGYRIKPEPKYRPFANAEECWAEMLKHQPFGWIKSKEDGSRSLITLIISEENIDINCIGGFNSDKIMKRFTFADGAVFGILEEE